MDIFYECEYVLDRKKYLSWGRENYMGSNTRGAIVLMWIFFAAFATWGIYYEQYYALLIFFLSILYRVFFEWRIRTGRQYSLLVNKYGTENWIRRISFSEDSIITSEANVSVNTPCSELTEIEEKGNYIKLHLKNGNIIRLYSDCFVKGTWEECKAHLLWQDQTGVFTE